VRVSAAAILGLGLLVAASAAANGPSFSIEYKMEGYQTLFRVVSPEGARCQVVSDSSWFGEQAFEVPFKFKAQANYYYTFDCRLPDGAIWHKKLEPKANHTTILAIGGGGGGHDAPQAGPAPPQAISAGAFAALLRQVTEASFEQEKLSAIELAAGGNNFDCQQVGQLVAAFSFPDAQLKAIGLTAARIIDPGNSFAILERFTFPNDKKKAQRLLANAGSNLLRSSGGEPPRRSAPRPAYRPAPPPPRASGNQPMGHGSFQALLQQVSSLSFPSEQHAAISLAAGSNHFSCNQVSQLLAAFSFGGDKIKALSLVARRISDPQNQFTILAGFTFDSEKEEARQLLAR